MILKVTLTAGDYLELTLWMISIILMAIVGAMLINEYAKTNKNLVLSGLFFYWFIAARICRLYAKFVIGYEVGQYEFTGVLFTLQVLYTLFSYIGLFSIYFAIEKVIMKKSHFFFSFMVVLATVLSILNYIYTWIFYILIPIYIIVLFGLPGVFLNMAIKGSGKIRTNSLLVVIGIILFELGIVFDIPEAQQIWIAIPGLLDVIKFLAPCLQIGGTILIKKGFPKMD